MIEIDGSTGEGGGQILGTHAHEHTFWAGRLGVMPGRDGGA